MALASAGKVPARGRKFVVFGLFFMVFCLDCNGPRVKIWHQLAPAREKLAPAREELAPAREPRFKLQATRTTVQGMYYHFTQCGQF